MLVFLSNLTTFIALFIIAFSKSWKMALVVLTTLPLTTFVVAAIAKVHREREEGRNLASLLACKEC